MAEMSPIGHVLTNLAILLAETQVAPARLNCRYNTIPDQKYRGV